MQNPTCSKASDMYGLKLAQDCYYLLSKNPIWSFHLIATVLSYELVFLTMKMISEEGIGIMFFFLSVLTFNSYINGQILSLLTHDDILCAIY